MAEGKIRVKFEAKDSDKLISAIRSLNTETKKLTGSTRKYETTGQRLPKNVNNQNKAFGALGGTLSVLRSKFLLYGFAVQQASSLLLGASKRASQFTSLKDSFNDLTDSANFSADSFEKLAEATDGTISKMDLYRQANNALLLGIFESSDQMAEMFDIAQRLGKALGQDTVMSIESLVTGLGRQSKLMLDNLGIVFSVEKAYKEYAKELGKNVDALTDAEKKQAFTNKAIKEAKGLVSDLSDETFTLADAINLWSSATKNFLTESAPSFLAWLFKAAPAMSGVDRKFQQLAHSQNGFNKAIDDGFDGHAKYIGIMDKINRMQSAVEVLDAMKERIALNEEESTSIDKVSTSLIREATILEMIKMNYNNVTSSSAQMFSALGKGAAQFEKGAKASARLQQISAVINAYAAINKVMADPKLVFPTNVITATAIGVSAFANVAAISNQINDFEDGGLIQGRRHSAGGTLINAEDGEFVMSRNAVSAIGVENLNRMNQGQSGGGGINISINGGMISPDFVENELAESIREAVRRGADFGIS